MELDLDTSCPKKIQFFIWKSMHERLTTRQFLAFSCPSINDRCPRCNNIETTSHILRDCSWAKVIWLQSPGILPLSFFQLPLQIWLKTNSKLEKNLPGLKLPWSIFFLFLFGKFGYRGMIIFLIINPSLKPI